MSFAFVDFTRKEYNPLGAPPWEDSLIFFFQSTKAFLRSHKQSFLFLGVSKEVEWVRGPGVRMGCPKPASEKAWCLESNGGR